MVWNGLVLALHIHEISALVVSFVGLLALALAAVGVASYRRSGARGTAFVAAAFALLGLKSIWSAWALWTRAVAHEDQEFILAVADLGVVVLLALPLFLKRRR